MKKSYAELISKITYSFIDVNLFSQGEMEKSIETCEYVMWSIYEMTLALSPINARVLTECDY